MLLSSRPQLQGAAGHRSLPRRPTPPQACWESPEAVQASLQRSCSDLGHAGQTRCNRQG